ncbi:STERILE APETALA [Hibiscus trionum]|uniref:STERILE APETALA n=1 Tax=Hibiscus trionum TaxID=183268 RepID=A0A9W7H4I4_HIBTR|nr:STERILE APETALA [Hibiscus trionum]
MSSSSSSSSEDGNDNSAPRRGFDFGGPSLTHRRAINEIWPGPFLEDLVVQVAIDASRSLGRLAAAAALANVFQVCSTWRAVSHSAPLWFRLTRIIWGRTHRMHPTWRDEYVYRHRTARNFRAGGSYHHTLHFDPSNIDSPDGLMCRCLTLSDTHLACGFADGTVRIFELATRQHVRTLFPYQGARFGRFSRAVAGIVIAGNRIVFATLDGDIHVTVMDGQPFPRRAHIGNVVEDGPLVDFTGCGRWWVGLYAGVPGRAFHIWDGNTEEMVYVNPLIASLTNSEAVMGWHMLTEFIEPIGRVRMTNRETAVACASLRYMILDMRNQGFPLHDQERRRGLRVTCFDTNNEAFITVDNRGRAVVRRVETLEEVCRFQTRQSNMTGCMNWGYALVCAGGVVRVWEIEQGQYLYSLNENIGGVNTMVADDRYVAAVSRRDTTIHLWDFGAM